MKKTRLNLHVSASSHFIQLAIDFLPKDQFTLAREVAATSENKVPKSLFSEKELFIPWMSVCCKI